MAALWAPRVAGPAVPTQVLCWLTASRPFFLSLRPATSSVEAKRDGMRKEELRSGEPSNAAPPAARGTRVYLIRLLGSSTLTRPSKEGAG